MTASRPRKPKAAPCVWVDGTPPSPGLWWVRHVMPEGGYVNGVLERDVTQECVAYVRPEMDRAVTADAKGCSIVWMSEVTAHAPVVRPGEM